MAVNLCCSFNSHTLGLFLTLLFFQVFFFKCGPFLRFLMNLLQYCLFHVLFFWLQGMWDLSSQPGTEPTFPALEGDILTTGPPGKSLHLLILF